MSKRGQTRTATNVLQDPQDIVDDLERLALNGWEPSVKPVLNALQRLADDCEDEEEFKRRLPEVVNTADLSELTTSLATAMFKVRAAGDADET
jgi:phage gp29-like protein